MPHKIALSGKMCSGKTSAANVLLESEAHNFVKLSFADDIYALCGMYFGMDRDNKNRAMLIKIGQTFREFDPDVWVKRLLKRADELMEQGYDVVVDDVRMPNELCALIEADWTVIRLNVTKEVQLKRLQHMYPDKWEEHASKTESVTETALDGKEQLYHWSSFVNPFSTLDEVRTIMMSSIK